MLRSTCTSACACTSPPGVPSVIGLPSGPNAIATMGVSRGRLPGAAHDGCDGSAKLCDPRDDGQRPVPGMTGVSYEGSLGVAANTLPSLSITLTCDVSCAPAEARSRVDAGATRASRPGTTPAGGMPGDA